MQIFKPFAGIASAFGHIDLGIGGSSPCIRDSLSFIRLALAFGFPVLDPFNRTENILQATIQFHTRPRFGRFGRVGSFRLLGVRSANSLGKASDSSGVPSRAAGSIILHRSFELLATGYARSSLLGPFASDALASVEWRSQPLLQLFKAKVGKRGYRAIGAQQCRQAALFLGNKIERLERFDMARR